VLWRLRRANLKAQHSSAVQCVCAPARQNGAQTSRRSRERTLAAPAPVPVSACLRCLPIATSPGPSQPPAAASVAGSRAAGEAWACVAARAACSRGPRPGSREVSADVVTHRVLSLPQPRASSSLLSTASSASRCSATGWEVEGRPAAQVRRQQAHLLRAESASNATGAGAPSGLDQCGDADSAFVAEAGRVQAPPIRSATPCARAGS